MDTLKRAIMLSATCPARESEQGTFVRKYSFVPNFIGFSGHFPGYPILPAFVQILVVLVMAEEIKGCPLKLFSLEKAKFHIEIYPDNEIEVQYREGVIKGRASLEATLTVDKGLAASFLLTFTEIGHDYA
jgi:3-hydroxyacyl-[acyl-carrier-protein] dehydratase